MVGSGRGWGHLERAETRRVSGSSVASSVSPREQANRWATAQHALGPALDSGEVTRPRAWPLELSGHARGG
jgi:hypothetical protein